MAEKTIEKTSILTSNNFSTGLTLGVQAYKTISEWNAPNINYKLLNLQADYRDNQAASIELDAQEQANYLRGQFSEAVGSFKSGMAQRNVKVGEGSGQMNIEDSARDLGYDISKMKGNAEFKANMLRSQADQYRAGAEATKEVDQWKKIGNLFDNISTMAGLFGKFEAKKTTEKVTETKKDNKPVPAKTEPTKKQETPATIAKIDDTQTMLPFDIGEEKRVSKSTEEGDLTIGKETWNKVELQKMDTSNKMKLVQKAAKNKVFNSMNELVKYFSDLGLEEKEIYATLRSGKNA